eukprot:12408537-Karenia_brevis.AAC.1
MPFSIPDISCRRAAARRHSASRKPSRTSCCQCRGLICKNCKLLPSALIMQKGPGQDQPRHQTVFSTL